MKPLLPFFLFFLLSTTKTYAQGDNYKKKSEEAYAFYEMGEYQRSAELYTKLFASFDEIKTWDYYNAACSWALAGQKDSSFIYLFLATKKGFFLLDHIQSDKDLASLHKANRWEQVVAEVRKNKEKSEAKFDKKLVRILNKVHETDQQPRLRMDSISKKYGWDSEEMKKHWQLIQRNDSINELEVTKILDERGWLGSDLIGQQGNITLFLVIQHAGLDVQKKYLPMLKDAVRKGNAQPSNLALLEDRVALRSGKPQIYGSQIGQDPDTKKYELQPMIEPRKVNERRASVGLDSIEDYIANWSIEWEVEEYIKRLPALRKRYKIKK